MNHRQNLMEELEAASKQNTYFCDWCRRSKGGICNLRFDSCLLWELKTKNIDLMQHEPFAAFVAQEKAKREAMP